MGTVLVILLIVLYLIVLFFAIPFRESSWTFTSSSLGQGSGMVQDGSGCSALTPYSAGGRRRVHVYPGETFMILECPDILKLGADSIGFFGRSFQFTKRSLPPERSTWPAECNTTSSAGCQSQMLKVQDTYGTANDQRSRAGWSWPGGDIIMGWGPGGGHWTRDSSGDERLIKQIVCWRNPRTK